MKFDKTHIVNTMRETGLVPLFTHNDPTDAQHVLETAYDAGVRTFEFTNRSKNAFEVFVHLLKVAKQYPDLMLGIGTIMDAATTVKFIEAGAHFIISPVMKLEMAEVCNRYNILWIPGCATLTEIVTAKEHGAEVIKVFPGSVLGPGFVSAIMPVVPGLQLMITGGVEPKDENLRAWFRAGAMCVGMGSQLFTKEILEKKDWAKLGDTIGGALSAIKKVRALV